MLSAKEVKINSKAEIKSFKITIEKAELVYKQVLIYGIIKQKPRFSYSVAFDSCGIRNPYTPDTIPGKLVLWNGNRKISSTIKLISNDDSDSFILAFPEGVLPETGLFDLRIGTIQDRDKTQLIIPDLSLQKK